MPEKFDRTKANTFGVMVFLPGKAGAVMTYEAKRVIAQNHNEFQFELTNGVRIQVVGLAYIVEAPPAGPIITPPPADSL